MSRERLVVSIVALLVVLAASGAGFAAAESRKDLSVSHKVAAHMAQVRAVIVPVDLCPDGSRPDPSRPCPQALSNQTIAPPPTVAPGHSPNGAKPRPSSTPPPTSQAPAPSQACPAGTQRWPDDQCLAPCDDGSEPSPGCATTRDASPAQAGGGCSNSNCPSCPDGSQRRLDGTCPETSTRPS